MSSIIFDYAIIGAGAAGFHLAMAMLKDPYFYEKQVLIIDKTDKDINDKTWCFWEDGEGQWDDIIHHSWHHGSFITSGTNKNLNLGPYQYKMLRSVDFYRHCKNELKNISNFYWQNDTIQELYGDDPVEIIGLNQSYKANQVFDSRTDQGYYDGRDQYLRILQHFKGWVIQTEKAVFNPKKFIMMDFRVKWKKKTSFTVVLPTKSNQALVEFTLFTPQLIADKAYDEMLETYIEKILKTDYSILDIEKGVIPMTDYPFNATNRLGITKIGTAGSWVKPASGYSFKNAEKFSRIITENLKTGLEPSQNVADKRHRLYDPIFLEVLLHNNHLGEKIFTAMYEKRPASLIFKFLDEETDLKEDLKIINSFQSNPFLIALFRQLKELI